MSDWLANLDDLAAVVTDPAAFGEPGTLLGGAVVYGVFDPMGEAAGGWGSEIGLRGRLSAQPNPVFDLANADAAGLAEGAPITIRGVTYLITRLDPDGYGRTCLLLMPAATATGTEPGMRYR